MAKPTFYAPENNEAKKITRLIAPVEGNGQYIGKLYGSVDGKTKLVGRFRHTKLVPPPPPKPAISMAIVDRNEDPEVPNGDGVTVGVGDFITYQIEYSNDTAEIANMKIRVTYPNAEWIESSIRPTTNEADAATFSLGSVSPGDSGTFTFAISVGNDALLVTDATNGFVLTVSAKVYFDGQGGDMVQITNPVPGLNETYIEQPEGAPASGKPTLEWGEDGQLHGDMVYVGSKITYSIKYMNGYKDKRPVYITVYLDRNTSYDSYGSSTYFTYDEEAHKITAQLDDVLSGSGGTQGFKVKVLDSAAPNGSVNIVAYVKVGNEFINNTVSITNPTPKPQKPEG